MKKKDRIQKAIAYLKGRQIINTQNDIVLAIGGNKSNVSSAINGDERYIDGFIKKFSDTYRYFNIEWLQTGEGEMLKKENISYELHDDSQHDILNVVNEERAMYGSNNGHNCQFEPICVYKKSSVFFGNVNVIMQKLQAYDTLQAQLNNVQSHLNSVLILLAKAQMKLLHFYEYARQHEEVAKMVNIQVAENILHDIETVEKKFNII